MTKGDNLSRDKLMGIITMILGVMELASPVVAGDHVLMLTGILVTIVGGMRMVWAFKSPSFDKSLWTFLLGVLTLLAGLATLANPAMAGELLAIFLLIYLAGDGFIEFIWGLTLQSRPGKVWLMVGGIMSLLFAFYIFTQLPIPAAVVIGVIMGVKLIIIGITMLKFETTFESAVKGLAD